MVEISEHRIESVLFQFQDGSIKVMLIKQQYDGLDGFQFQDGSIKVLPVRSEIVETNVFQFQDGSIKVNDLTSISKVAIWVSIPRWFD